ncbi:DUF2141 domain-containing protein [Salinivirga cyanobacteriivorans]|nr:DUF2141 domain-containing protein [Salinivirga cyanobacteriivorans]
MNKLLIVLGLSLLGQVLLAQNYDITIEITGFKSHSGNCIVTLFDNSHCFSANDKGISQVKKAITKAKTCTVTFKNIPKGNYAIIAFHDENTDGALNRNLLGMPKEGVGNSNNHKGKPSFEKSRFILLANRSVKIEIKYQ